MPKTKLQTESINIRLSTTLLSGLNDIVTNKGLSKTEYIRYLIQSDIERYNSK